MNGPGWMANSTKFHTAVVAAFEAGDADAAERIRENSILGQIKEFSKIFKNGGEQPQSQNGCRMSKYLLDMQDRFPYPSLT